MKKFTEKHRFSGTIFENKDLLDDYIVSIEDLGIELLSQTFHVFKYFNNDLFPVQKIFYGLEYKELTNVDQEILSKFEDELFIGTELTFHLSLDFHCANAQRSGDIFYKPTDKLVKLFQEIEDISKSLERRNYTTSFTIVNRFTEATPQLKLMIIYNK